MLVCHIGDGVFVASKTGIDRSAAWVAGNAGHDRILAVGQREGVLEGRRLPGAGGVTGGAVRAGLARVDIL